jgi:sugar/nucleoside kinase (ribokinase family)
MEERAELDLQVRGWNYCELWCKAYTADPGKVRNSSGAGDTTVAAFLTALLRGNDPDTAVRAACMAGRDNLYCRQAFEDLRTWDEMNAEIRTNPVDIIKL